MSSLDLYVYQPLLTEEEETKTVADLLKEKNLSDKYFVVLVNGKPASLTDRISEEDEVIVLPKLVGG